MILVTRINGAVFALNPDLVERADCTPDTVVTLVDGTKYVIAESVPKASHAGHRERRLAAHIDRFLTDSAALGYSPREAIKELTRRLKEGEN